jgi:hypothetical protein
MEQYKVTRNGKTMYGPGTHDRCFQYIHDAQGQSVDWAVKYEGWKIEPIDELDAAAERRANVIRSLGGDPSSPREYPKPRWRE